MAGGGGGGAAVAQPRSRLKLPAVRKRARIEIIPLIDVMFFLLAAFMMVSLSMQKMKTPRMDLAIAKTAKPDFKPDILNIAVQRNGDISVGKTNVNVVRLDEILATAAKRGTNTPIFISGDKEASHGSINRVLERVRMAGFLRVSFTVDSPKEVSN
ncbi:MAG TPA: biopolymer transporter ExbD [Verrucomicrobiota bacterium]|nr:biopolymer transporter ExbD [Verrucomicrobiales bacterium]HRI12647.1 biopolymer transporter ExbD [Verrucomicrobiota bacterium]